MLPGPEHEHVTLDAEVQRPKTDSLAGSRTGESLEADEAPDLSRLERLDRVDVLIGDRLNRRGLRCSAPAPLEALDGVQCQEDGRRHEFLSNAPSEHQTDPKRLLVDGAALEATVNKSITNDLQTTRSEVRDGKRAVQLNHGLEGATHG